MTLASNMSFYSQSNKKGVDVNPLVAFVLAGTVATALTAQTAKELTTPKVFTDANGETLPYRLYMPPSVPAEKKLPVVLFLHGAGERGSNNISQLTHGITPLLQYTIAAKDPVILIAPQCPIGLQWVDTPWSNLSHTMPEQPSKPMRLALALLQETLRTRPVDLTRVYVTGISMGGYGTWDAAQRHPDWFAAAMPVCGGGDTACAERLKHMPIWIFHGDKDGAVPVKRARDMFAALKACDGQVQYREYPGRGHNVWTPTYDDQSVLAWLLAQRKK